MVSLLLTYPIAINPVLELTESRLFRTSSCKLCSFCLSLSLFSFPVYVCVRGCACLRVRVHARMHVFVCSRVSVFVCVSLVCDLWGMGCAVSC